MQLLIRELEEDDSLQMTELDKSFGLLMDIFENGDHGYTGGITKMILIKRIYIIVMMKIRHMLLK